MSSTEDGIMVVLSSPSGAGKTTISRLLSKKKNFSISVSHTTRISRTNEIEAKDYYFVNKEKFKLLIKNNEFLEYAEVFNNLYGTLKSPVVSKLEKGENLIFDIDWQGTEQIKNKKLRFKLISFFILPPSKKVLFDRLLNRHMKDKLIVEERMKQFDKDLLHWKKYNFVAINDDLETCYNQIVEIIKAKLNQTIINYDQQFIDDHIKKLIQ